MTTSEIKLMIQNFVNGFGTGCSKEKMIENVYWFLHNNDVDCCILNDKYIEYEGHVIELIRKRSIGIWVVKVVK